MVESNKEINKVEPEQAPEICDAHVFVRKRGAAYTKCSKIGMTGIAWEVGEIETPQNNEVISAHREECDDCPFNKNTLVTSETA